MIVVIPTKFSLGQVIATACALEAHSEETIEKCLNRHASGDWGDLTEEDRQSNEDALAEGDRLFSSYEISENKDKLWIITEWDRSVTTILLPSDY